MKKLLVLLLSLILITGCATEGSDKITNGDDVIFTLGNTTVDTNEVYTIMNANVGSSAVIEGSLKIVITKEFAEEYTMEDLSDSTTLNEAVIKLINKYFDANAETYITPHAPKQVEIMTFTDEALANQAHALITEGKTTAEAATEIGYLGSTAPTILTLTSDIPLDIKAGLEAATEPTLLPVVYDEESASYYVVNVVDTDVNNYKEEYFLTLTSDTTAITAAYAYYFDLYNFDVYVQEIYDAVESNASWAFN